MGQLGIMGLIDFVASLDPDQVGHGLNTQACLGLHWMQKTHSVITSHV